LFASPVIIALLIRIVVSQDSLYLHYQGTKMTLAAMVMACVFIGLFNSIQEICGERAIIKREYLANLKLNAFVSSKITVQFCIAVLQGIIFTLVCKGAFGLPPEGFFIPDSFLEILCIFTGTLFVSSVLGLFISSLVKTIVQVSLVTPMVLIIQLLFSGMLFDVSFVSYLTVSYWPSRMIGVIAKLNELPLRNEERWYTEAMYERTAENILSSGSIMVGMALVFCVGCMYILQTVRKDTR
jgi:hypothetical protein